MLLGHKKHITHDETIVMCLNFLLCFDAFRIFTRDNLIFLFLRKNRTNIKLPSINQSRNIYTICFLIDIATNFKSLLTWIGRSLYVHRYTLKTIIYEHRNEKRYT